MHLNYMYLLSNFYLSRSKHFVSFIQNLFTMGIPCS